MIHVRMQNRPPYGREQRHLGLSSAILALVHLARFGVLGRFHLCEEGLRLRSARLISC